MVDWDSPDKHGVDGWYQFNLKIMQMRDRIRELEGRVSVLEEKLKDMKRSYPKEMNCPFDKTPMNPHRYWDGFGRVYATIWKCPLCGHEEKVKDGERDE